MTRQPTPAAKWFRDSDNRLVLFQVPNAPIIIWFVATVTVKLLAAGTWEILARAIAFSALALWTILEIFWGVNYFRRALGVLVLATILLHAFAQ